MCVQLTTVGGVTADGHHFYNQGNIRDPHRHVHPDEFDHKLGKDPLPGNLQRKIPKKWIEKIPVLSLSIMEVENYLLNERNRILEIHPPIFNGKKHDCERKGNIIGPFSVPTIHSQNHTWWLMIHMLATNPLLPPLSVGLGFCCAPKLWQCVFAW